MTIKWGDPIECNGVRPGWLRDGTPCAIDQGKGLIDNDWPAEEWSWWDGIRAFYLPADHPAYVALARGFTPWSSGDSAPDDWDGGEVLLCGGVKECPGPLVTNWGDDLGISTIIGYRKRIEYGGSRSDGSRSGGQPPRYAPCDFSEKDLRRAAEERETTSFAQAIERGEAAFIMRRPESDWIEWGDALGGSEASIITALGQLGLIRPESRAERFTRETGHAVTEAVEAALNWKET